MKRHLLLLATVLLLLSSCASLSPNGVGRIKRYTVESEQLPSAFDGCRVAFVSDTHYPSLFGRKRLPELVACLKELAPDLLLLGGDYVTDDDSIDVLFKALGSVDTSYGTFAVLGNHERRNHAQIVRSMEEYGIKHLDDELHPLACNGEQIYLAGVSDSFSDTLSFCPTRLVGNDEFVVLLAHTPDYAERTGTTADLVLSGHTHGGQVSLFGIYTPVRNSMYGARFLRGKNMTSNGSVVITTNGVGTSRRKIRMFVPSEIVVVELKSLCGK